MPLKHFVPFRDMPESSLILLESFVEKVELKSGERLFSTGDEDPTDYFLLEGEVVLLTDQGEADKINSHSDKARTALSFLRSRQLSGAVHSAMATFYRLPHNVLQMAYEQTRESASFAPRLEVVIGDMPEETFLKRVKKEVLQERLTLVSLPEVALKLKEACEDKDSALDDIANIISHDGSIAVKLLQAANSPIYRGNVDIKTVSEAVCRLGKETTQHLVFYFATKELFQSSVKSLEQAFRDSWNDSFKRAIMAKTIAQLSDSRFNPDIAFLCDLLFRIGDLLLLQYVADHVGDAAELQKIQQITEKESAANSRLVVSTWNLPAVVTEVLNHGGDWAYVSTEEQGNYNDLIITSNVLLRVMNKNLNGLPAFADIPALRKVLNANFAPSASIIRQYRKQLDEF